MDLIHGSTLVSYNAGISACEKGGQWPEALSLLREMDQVKLEPNVISYNAGVSACEKGKQWPEALSLLREMEEVKVEPNVILTTMLQSERASAGRE